MRSLEYWWVKDMILAKTESDWLKQYLKEQVAGEKDVSDAERPLLGFATDQSDAEETNDGSQNV